MKFWICCSVDTNKQKEAVLFKRLEAKTKKLISGSLGRLWLKLLSHHVGVHGHQVPTVCENVGFQNRNLKSVYCHIWALNDKQAVYYRVKFHPEQKQWRPPVTPVTLITTSKTWQETNCSADLKVEKRSFKQPEPAVQLQTQVQFILLDKKVSQLRSLGSWH